MSGPYDESLPKGPGQEFEPSDYAGEPADRYDRARREAPPGPHGAPLTGPMTGLPEQRRPKDTRTGPSSEVTDPLGRPLDDYSHRRAQDEQAAKDRNPSMFTSGQDAGWEAGTGANDNAISFAGGEGGPSWAGAGESAQGIGQAIGQGKQLHEVSTHLVGRRVLAPSTIREN